MATLKEHQAAMVDLLANGSGIPASASRLAHAMHDVLVYITEPAKIPEGFGLPLYSQRKAMREQETTPGLNDKDLAGCADTGRLKVKGGMFDRAMAAEQRVKELENTIKQLKANNAKLRKQIAESAPAVDLWNRWATTPPEQAGCRKADTQLPPAEVPCDHPEGRVDTNIGFCSKCGNFL